MEVRNRSVVGMAEQAAGGRRAVAGGGARRLVVRAILGGHAVGQPAVLRLRSLPLGLRLRLPPHTAPRCGAPGKLLCAVMQSTQQPQLTLTPPGLTTEATPRALLTLASMMSCRFLNSFVCCLLQYAPVHPGSLRTWFLHPRYFLPGGGRGCSKDSICSDLLRMWACEELQ